MLRRRKSVSGVDVRFNSAVRRLIRRGRRIWITMA